MVNPTDLERSLKIRLLIRAMGIEDIALKQAQDHALLHGIRLEHPEWLLAARMDLLERIEMMMAEHMSDQDIDEVTAFYRSRAGRRWATMQVVTSKQFGDLIEQYMSVVESHLQEGP